MSAENTVNFSRASLSSLISEVDINLDYPNNALLSNNNMEFMQS